LTESAIRGHVFFTSSHERARLSPLIHYYIDLLGRYSLAVPVARGELRTVRNPAAETTAVGRINFLFLVGTWSEKLRM